MAAWVLPAAMLAMSAAKAHGDAQREKKDRQYQAEVIRNSPWTGMQAQAPQRADTFGTMTQGLASGLAMQQAMNTQENQQALLEAQKGYYNRGASMPMTGGGPTATAYSPQDSQFDQYMRTGRLGSGPQMSSASPWSYMSS